MLSKAKSLVRNHWKKVVYGGIVYQVASYGLRYATRRVIEGQQEKAKEVWTQMKKHEHFEKTHANAVSTYLSLLPVLRDKINHCLNSEILTASLKENPSHKLTIWEELKCFAFSRMLASIYASSILSILLNIQLSVMGGYLIKDCCSKKLDANSRSEESATSSSTSNGSIDEQLQHEYLSLSDYFIQEGMEKLCSVIYEQTKIVVGAMPLSRKLTVHDLEQTIWHIIESLKNEDTLNPFKNSWTYIFPPPVLSQYENFRRVYGRPLSEDSTLLVDTRELIMTETFDLLQSQDVEFLMTSFETFGVSSFLDQLMDIVAVTTPQNNNNNTTTTSDDHIDASSSSTHLNHHPNCVLPHEVSIPLAKLIPIVNNFFPNNLQPSNPWIISVTQAEKLRDFSANVYESFSSPFPL